MTAAADAEGMDGATRDKVRAVQTAAAAGDFGDGVFRSVLPFLALSVTSSAGMVGLLTATFWLPWLLVAIPVGVLVDRVDLRRLLRQVVLVRIAILLGLLLLVGLHRVWLPALFAFCLLLGTLGVVYSIGVQSLVNRTVPASRRAASNARILAAQSMAGQVVGPNAGSWLAGAGLALPLGVQLAGYACCGFALWGQPGDAAGKAPAAQPPRARLLTGLRILLGRPDLRALASAAFLQNLAYSATTTALALYAVRPGPLGLAVGFYGAMLSMVAVGGIVGAAAAHRWPQLTGSPTWLRVCVVAAGAGLATVGLGSSAAGPMTGLLCYGVAAMVANITILGYRQESIPASLFGQVNAAYRWVAWGAMPLGSAVAGYSYDALGARPVFWVAGLTLALGALALRNLALDGR